MMNSLKNMFKRKKYIRRNLPRRISGIRKIVVTK